jgi:hypothetical protein
MKSTIFELLNFMEKRDQFTSAPKHPGYVPVLLKFEVCAQLKYRTKETGHNDDFDLDTECLVRSSLRSLCRRLHQQQGDRIVSEGQVIALVDKTRGSLWLCSHSNEEASNIEHPAPCTMRIKKARALA